MIAALLTLALAAGAEEIPKGKLVDKVVCQGNASQSYALYLPSNYDPGRIWPTLYCFDPMARGRVPVERFREGAEKYGYIVAGSNNARNGPWPEIAEAIKAVWGDTQGRLSIDRRRVYAAGFSGGARAANWLAVAVGAAGVIACGGGFPGGATPETVGYAFFGVAGTDDFNYHEMRQIGRELDARGAVHRIAIFNGEHSWAPVPLATEALEWFELQAMRAGLRPKDEALIQTMFRARIEAARSMPAPEAYLEYKSLAAEFKGAVPTAELEKKAAELAGLREVRDWEKKEREQQKRQEEMIKALMDFGYLDQLGEVRATVVGLRKKADAEQDSADRRQARRVLYGAFVEGYQASRDFLDKKEYARAAGMLEMAAVIRPERAQVFYDLAHIRALAGEKKKALAALKQAVAGGFKDASRVEQDPAFAALRNDAAFQALLAAMKH